MIDLHIHTQFSFDSRENPQSYILQAQIHGCTAVGFSEHYDYDAYLDGAEDIKLCDLKAYTDNAKLLKSQCEGTLQLLCGIEYGYRAEAVDHYNRQTAKYGFDYVINSLHTIKDRGDCYHDSFFKEDSLKDSYAKYLEAVLESVTSQLDYDIVGHIGYVSRYRKGENVRLTYKAFPTVLDEILTQIISRGKCLELNTSTGTSGSAFLPDEEIVRRYVQLGGQKLSVGSDAHSINGFMRNFSEARKFLLSLGIDKLYYFVNRQAIAYNL